MGILVPDVLAKENLPEVAKCMQTPRYINVGGFLAAGFKLPQELTVSGNIVELNFPNQINALLETSTDTVLFTDASAVPLVDLFRGIYDEAGLAHPTWGVIAIDRDYCGTKSIGCYESCTEEIEGNTVAVVDQYFASGMTLSRATEVAQHLGATSVTPITGQFYMQAFLKEIGYDKNAMTTNLAADLQLIGRQLVSAV